MIALRRRRRHFQKEKLYLGGVAEDESGEHEDAPDDHQDDPDDGADVGHLDCKNVWLLF